MKGNLLLFVQLPFVVAIVNPDPEGTANIVLSQRRNPELGPATWKAGVECLANVSNEFFQLREGLTRAYNLVMAVSSNLTTPAEQIQQDFLIYMHHLVNSNPRGHDIFQLRLISDAEPYNAKRMMGQGLIYADFYVIVLDRAEQLEYLMGNYLSRMNSWNAGGLFLVMYHNATNRNREHETSMEIFRTFNRYYVHRAALLYATNRWDYNFNIMLYYMNEPCRVTSFKTFAECRQGELRPPTLLRKMKRAMKQVRYKNCTINACASISPPFIEKDCILGIELRIIGFIKNRLGFNLNVSCMNESRGVMAEDGELSGLLAKLNSRDCDVILGGFYPDDEVLERFRTTDCYLSDSHTFFVKLAAPKPPWLALYSIFKNETWLCFIFMMLITWILWYAFVNLLPEPKSHRGASMTGVNNMGVTICYAVNERPNCAASRIFFISLSLYGLNVTSTYTSKLIDVLSNPGYLHQIDNLDDTVAEGIPFGGFEESRDWFDNDPWIQARYNYSLLFEPTEENLEAVEDGKRAILSSRMFILQSKLSDRMHAMSGNIFSSPLQIIVKPGFVFLLNFNELIRTMRDVGIMQKIDREFRLNNTYLNRIARMRPYFQEEIIVLTTDHLQGPFAILIVGISASTLSFLWEYFNFNFIQPMWLKQTGSDDAMKNPKKKKGTLKSRSPKLKNSYVDNGFKVQVIKPVRFTPLSRRKVV